MLRLHDGEVLGLNGRALSHLPILIEHHGRSRRLCEPEDGKARNKKTSSGEDTAALMKSVQIQPKSGAPEHFIMHVGVSLSVRPHPFLKDNWHIKMSGEEEPFLQWCRH